MYPTLKRTFDSPFALIREVDRALNTYQTPSYPVDIYETPDHFVIHADLPGYHKDDVEINLDANVLTVAAQRAVPEDQGEARVTERSFERVERAFRLPDTVNADSVDASMDQGVLTVKLSKRDEVKPRKITVN